MSIFDHVSAKGSGTSAAIEPETRLSPAIALLTITGLSILCWAVVIFAAIGMAKIL